MKKSKSPAPTRKKSPSRKAPLAELFNALSDPLRLQVVKNLLSEEELTCGSCTGGVSKSTFTHHLKILEQCGLIQREICGKNHWISLNRPLLKKEYPELFKLLKRL
jgi:DNA-binding transcriptional ArsR family regulator